ncbi:MAG: M48 family metallopeptidase [Defluviitaleaceae bacterium]|nr:M48 family metallopeptidase [Defluviitaleaceae bacterium]
MGIYIKGGEVEIRAPFRVPMREIEAFVNSKTQWINEVVTKQQKHAEAVEAFRLNGDSLILLRGQETRVADILPLRLSWGRKPLGASDFSDSLALEESDAIRADCVKFYQRTAKVVIAERVAYFSEKMGVSPASVKITSAKTRWGSCISKKRINFSWRLIMAHDDVIDYVVVHELAHLLEMNHSSRFWAIVAKILPDYKQRQAQLKILHRRIVHEGWN